MAKPQKSQRIKDMEAAIVTLQRTCLKLNCGEFESNDRLQSFRRGMSLTEVTTPDEINFDIRMSNLRAVQATLVEAMSTNLTHAVRALQEHVWLLETQEKERCLKAQTQAQVLAVTNWTPMAGGRITRKGKKTLVVLAPKGVGKTFSSAPLPQTEKPSSAKRSKPKSAKFGTRTSSSKTSK